jgi:hypothetical protein
VPEKVAPPEEPWCVPAIPLQSVPVSERRNVEHLNLTLGDLLRYTNDFGAALNLFIFCHSSLGETFDKDMQARARPWIFVAGRDGAMSIYHFGKAMEGTMAFLRVRPGTSSRIA